MLNCLNAILGLLILQTYVSAAPSNITTVEEIPQVKESTEVVEPLEVEEPQENINQEDAEPKLDSKPPLIEDSKLDDNSTNSLRQKRFYNFYGVPPINPTYPSYNKRDQSAETGVYGLVDDPFDQIQRRLHDIASFVRQPAPPPPPPPVHYPFFLPVIYIPYGCDCNSNSNEQPKPQDPPTPRPENNQTNPDVDNRIPPLEDERQNWGIVTNESDSDTEYDENEFSRPISFDPIESGKPLSRPAPPVDHGSSQGDAKGPKTTTARPGNANRPMDPPRPPPSQARPGSQGRPASGQPAAAPYPPSFAPNIPRGEQPTSCDAAVLSCCHQSQVTYDCFVLQGCPDPTSYGNPCDPLVILGVIDKYQRFYGVRNE